MEGSISARCQFKNSALPQSEAGSRFLSHRSQITGTILSDVCLLHGRQSYTVQGRSNVNQLMQKQHSENLLTEYWKIHYTKWVISYSNFFRFSIQDFSQQISYFAVSPVTLPATKIWNIFKGALKHGAVINGSRDWANYDISMLLICKNILKICDLSYKS